MERFAVITSNYIVNVGAVAWISAQLLKTLFTLILMRKFVPERLFGAGGMPSSHSALTTSITMAMARKLGVSSPEFGLALAFAAVVMYDAMGVRRAAGEQAKVLNRMVFEFHFPFFEKQREEQLREPQSNGGEDNGSDERKPSAESASLPLLDKELKEFLGHTPTEVLGGVLLGILVAEFMPVV